MVTKNLVVEDHPVDDEIMGSPIKLEVSNFNEASHAPFRSQKSKRDSFSLRKSDDKSLVGIGFIGNFGKGEIGQFLSSPNLDGILEANDNELSTDVEGSYDPSDRDAMILHYTPLIAFVANRIARRLPSHFELDDLFSSGVIGLIDAIEKYDPTRGAQFKTYAEFRIRGAMLDELRTMDWMPRAVRDNSNQIKKAVTQLEQKLGRPTQEDEVAEALGIEMDEYRKMVSRAAALSMLSLDMVVGHFGDEEIGFTLLDNLSGLEDDEPQAKQAFEELRHILGEAIDSLPEQQRLVVCLYYYQEMNMREISQVMKVTESRVSQVHSKAIAHIKECLGQCLTHFQR